MAVLKSVAFSKTCLVMNESGVAFLSSNANKKLIHQAP